MTVTDSRPLKAPPDNNSRLHLAVCHHSSLTSDQSMYGKQTGIMHFILLNEELVVNYLLIIRPAYMFLLIDVIIL